MQVLSSIVNSILGLGAIIFIPIILLIIGLVAGLKPGRALGAALLFGCAFAGVSMVISFLTTNVGAAAQAFVKAHGLKLVALDIGGFTVSSFVMQWSFAFLVFPLQIGLNILLLALGKTKTMNVDMWNVTQKILTAYMVVTVSHNVIIAFVIATAQIIIELKIADATRKDVQELTGIPGISVPHAHVLNCIWFYPLNKLYDKILPTKRKIDVAALKEKIGIFGENQVLGFIVGSLIGFFGGYPVAKALTVGIQAATALTLLPMAIGLFPRALVPISEAAQKLVEKRFPGKEIVVGLDWPVLAGGSEIWVVEIVSVPIILAISMVLPGNIVLPFATLLASSAVVPAYLAFKGDIIKMFITNLFAIPVFLWISSYFVPMFTEIAKVVGATSGMDAGSMVSWYAINISTIRWMVCEVTKFNPLAIGLVVLYAIFAVWFFKGKAKENLAREEAAM